MFQFKRILSKGILSRIVVYGGLIILGIWIYRDGADQGVTWYYKNNPDLLMKEIPFYTVLQKHDKELYDRMHLDILTALNNDESAHSLKIKVRQYLDTIIAKRVPIASNQAVVDYIKVTVQEMELLKKHGYGICYQFIYPSEEGVVDVSKYVHKNVMDEDLSSLTEVIRSSYEKPLELPNSQQAEQSLNQVMTRMSEKFGNDLNYLNAPMAENVNKDKVCALTIALFREILKLPPDEGGTVLRYMVSRQGSL